jgi:hypothetical protein
MLGCISSVGVIIKVGKNVGIAVGGNQTIVGVMVAIGGAGVSVGTRVGVGASKHPQHILPNKLNSNRFFIHILLS